MNKTRNFIELARGAWVPALCVGVIGYFAYHAIVGPTGLFAWGGYKRERVRLEQVASALDTRRAALSHRARLLDPRAVDPDMADELVRKNLGVVRPDELVIPLR